MERRDFIRKATVGAAAGTVLAGCGSGAGEGSGGPNVQARPTVRWRLASSFSRSLDTIYGVAEVMGERLRALTDDKFQIRTYPGGELVPPLEVLEAVQKGTAQMGHSASYYYIGKNPALAFDTTVPFGLTARQYNAWIYHGGGLDLLRRLFSDFNIINFPGGNTGTQMGGWFRNPVDDLADLRGLRMRIPGQGGRVMDALGVTVQQIPGSEIYPALERGAIDAVEWVGPYDDEKLGFHQIARYYYYPGWWEPGPALTFYVNRDAWDALPVGYQQALEVACNEASALMLASYDAKNPPAMARLLDQGIQVRPFPHDVMEAARSITDDLLASAADNAQYRSLYDAFQEWRASSHRWFRLAEHSYADFVYG